LDGQTRPQTVLVYDTVTRQWQGMDTYPSSVHLDRLHTARWLGRRELFSVDLDGQVLVHGVGRADDIAGTETAISDLFRTRGYLGGSNEVKRWRHVDIGISTWAPAVASKAIVEGIAEERTLGTFTRDRTKYNVHGRGTHDVTDGATHGTAHRQDYQIISSDGIDTGSGVYPEREQDFSLGLALREIGRWVAIEIANTAGTCAVRHVKVDGVRKLNNGRTAA
jgi:hypothetical protein